MPKEYPGPERLEPAFLSASHNRELGVCETWYIESIVGAEAPLFDRLKEPATVLQVSVCECCIHRFLLRVYVD